MAMETSQKNFGGICFRAQGQRMTNPVRSRLEKLPTEVNPAAVTKYLPMSAHRLSLGHDFKGSAIAAHRSPRHDESLVCRGEYQTKVPRFSRGHCVFKSFLE